MTSLEPHERLPEPLEGTRRVGGLLGVAGRLSGTVSPFRRSHSSLDVGLVLPATALASGVGHTCKL